MITLQQVWNGDQVMATLTAKSWEQVARMTAFFHAQVLRALNVSNPRPHVTPSLPGEPPRKRTGWLQRHVWFDLDKAHLTGRVGLGKPARYGLYLERGTKKMAARPFLLATLRKNWQALQAMGRQK